MSEIKKKTNPAPSTKTTATGKPGSPHETPRTKSASTPKAPQKKKPAM